jgi:hypothetical protein
MSWPNEEETINVLMVVIRLKRGKNFQGGLMRIWTHI